MDKLAESLPHPEHQVSCSNCSLTDTGMSTTVRGGFGGWEWVRERDEDTPACELFIINHTSLLKAF